MKLTEYTNIEFSKLLASDAPAPGGGSVAALSASLGIALTHMVASLTMGKPKYAAHDALIQETLSITGDLRIKLLDCMDRDTEIFGQMAAVFEMPRTNEEEKLARAVAMQKALKACTVVPYEIMDLCYDSLLATEKIVGKSNTSAASDLGVAALNLKAGIQGAWLNVLINIGGIKDEAFVNEYNEKCDVLLKKALPLADKIFQDIKERL